MTQATTPIFSTDAGTLIQSLPENLRQRFSLNQGIRDQHGHGEDRFGTVPPDAVFYASTTEEVAQLVTACNEMKIPVIPYGAGTSCEGQLIAVQGGISLDLSEMNAIIDIDQEDMICRVQAGVTRKQLNHELRHLGLFFPVDPGADASIGGMAATRASGTNAVRYGTMRENVLGLKVVTAQGEVICTGGKAKKSAAGYDLTRLFVGSEGTLGVMTEIQLTLYPIPEVIKAAVCSFETLEDSVSSVILAIQSGIPMARIELLNRLQIEACIRYSKLEGFASKPTLFLEFHGSSGYVQEQIDALQEITQEFGGSDYRWAETTEARNELWKARHEAYFAGQSIKPGCVALATDVCVPISRLAENLLAAEQRAQELDLCCPIVGHVGDGNYHMLILFDAEDAVESAKASELSGFLVAKALESGGTCTGEHGIGFGKKSYLLQEHGAAVALMKTLKRALDPNLIMNPGKVFDF
ncbi:MAG: D-lactate dehydrogenase (cytochrome) [Motiliproteus sp.]|jgi:D-lactate dehydrogenase (cytochrome)